MDNTQFQNISPADDISKKVNSHVNILESVPAPTEEHSVNSPESGPDLTKENSIQTSKVKKLKKRKPAPKIEDKVEDKVDGSSILVYIIKETFNLLNTIIKSPQGIMWGFLMAFMFQLALSQAAAVLPMDGSAQSRPQSHLSNPTPAPSCTRQSPWRHRTSSSDWTKLKRKMSPGSVLPTAPSTQ